MTTNKLKRLQELCNASILVKINSHRDYQSVISYFDDKKDLETFDKNEIENAIYEKMIELDTIIEIQFYPLTSVGFYTIYHYDIDMALDEAIKIIEREK